MDNTCFVLVDVQEKLAAHMHGREALEAALVKLLRGMLTLDIPVLWLEQAPDKLGPTLPILAEYLAKHTPLVKPTFSGAGYPAFMDALAATDRRHVILAGIETHVCVYQTAIDLTAAGFAVEVAADAVASRTALDHTVALRRLETEGVRLATVEMILFGLLRTTSHPRFREILRLVK